MCIHLFFSFGCKINYSSDWGKDDCLSMKIVYFGNRSGKSNMIKMYEYGLESLLIDSSNKT